MKGWEIVHNVTCAHRFCRPCAATALNMEVNGDKCPLCRGAQSAALMKQGLPSHGPELPDGNKDLRNRRSDKLTAARGAIPEWMQEHKVATEFGNFDQALPFELFPKVAGVNTGRHPRDSLCAV